MEKKKNGRYLDTKSPEAKKLIAKSKEELQKKNPDAIIVTGTTATFGVGNFEKAISKYSGENIFLGIEEHDPKNPKLIIPLVYHASSDFETSWDNGEAKRNRILIEQFIGSAGYILGSYRYVDLIVSVEND